MSAETHIAGPPITWDGRYLRQRCSWCGAVLLDYDLTRLASLDGEPPATWPGGELIRRDGPMSSVVEADQDSEGQVRKLAEIAPDACVFLDPAVTGAIDREDRYAGGFPITLETMVAHAKAHGQLDRLRELVREES